MAKGFSISDLMNAQSRPDQKQQRFEAKDIPIGLLKPSTKNEYGIRDIAELAASIESMGLMHTGRSPCGGRGLKYTMETV